MFCEIGAWKTLRELRELPNRDWWLLVGYRATRRRQEADAARRAAKQARVRR
jgi:hypothetical protein